MTGRERNLPTSTFSSSEDSMVYKAENLLRALDGVCEGRVMGGARLRVGRGEGGGLGATACGRWSSRLGLCGVRACQWRSCGERAGKGRILPHVIGQEGLGQLWEPVAAGWGHGSAKQRLRAQLVCSHVRRAGLLRVPREGRGRTSCLYRPLQPMLAPGRPPEATGSWAARKTPAQQLPVQCSAVQCCHTQGGNGEKLTRGGAMHETARAAARDTSPWAARCWHSAPATVNQAPGQGREMPPLMTSRQVARRLRFQVILLTKPKQRRRVTGDAAGSLVEEGAGAGDAKEDVADGWQNLRGREGGREG